MGSALNQRPFFEVLYARVPYYIGDFRRDPNLENCLHAVGCSCFAILKSPRVHVRK